MKIPQKHLYFWGSLVLFLLLDQWTKGLVRDHFFLSESIPVIDGFFNLTYVRNTGAAFGFLHNADPTFRVPFFLIVPMIALGVLGRMFWKLPANSRVLSLSLGFVVSGAIGNLIDRYVLGYVVDFLDFHWKYQLHFPAFNVADIVIVVGVALLMIDSWMQAAPSTHPPLSTRQ